MGINSFSCIGDCLFSTMSGRGKGGKGLGKGGAKRHRKVLRDNIQGITKPAIRRLARRGGVKRISGLIYEETRGVLKVFLENVIREEETEILGETEILEETEILVITETLVITEILEEIGILEVVKIETMEAETTKENPTSVGDVEVCKHKEVAIGLKVVIRTKTGSSLKVSIVNQTIHLTKEDITRMITKVLEIKAMMITKEVNRALQIIKVMMILKMEMDTSTMEDSKDMDTRPDHCEPTSSSNYILSRFLTVYGIMAVPGKKHVINIIL